VTKTLVVVHCYAGDQPLVEMMLPYWLHHGHPLLLLSPEDAPVNIEHPGVTCKSSGLRGWKGPHTIHRQIAHWKLTSEESFDYVFLNDADSLCLTPELPAYLYSEPDAFYCNVLCHEFEHREDDHPNLNPPYWMSHETLDKLITAADAVKEATPHLASSIDDDDTAYEYHRTVEFLEPHDWGQAIDGWYSHIVMNVLGLTWKDFFDGATTWPRGVAGMLAGVDRGARFLHGIKTTVDLQFAMMRYQGYLNRVPLNGSLMEGDTITL
jgi:hypothetical protein